MHRRTNWSSWGGRRRLRPAVAALLAALLVSLGAGSIPVARAAGGSVILEIAQARALQGGTDYAGILPWNFQQDFYPKLGVGDAVTAPALAAGPEIDQRDWTTWDPPFSQTKAWPDVRDLHGGDAVGAVELWDKDDVGSDDQFDINAAAGRSALRLRLDVCSLRFRSEDDPSRQFTGFAWMDAGSETDPGQVQVRMRTADGRSFLPNNVAIADATPVQAVYHPAAIVDGKATAFMLELTSSHPGAVGATVSVTLSDGFTSATDTKSVTVPPEGLRAFFFDGASAAPFVPHKQPNLRRLTYTVHVDVPADAHDPDPNGPFPNCVAAADNDMTASLPVVITDSPTTLYVPWDWVSPGGPAPRHPTPAEASATFASNERLRKAIFPIADTRSALLPGRAVSLKTTLEPAATIAGWSVAASMAGIDRVMLLARNGWFAENDSALSFGHGAIGMSLGEFAPHAVLVEQGFSEAAVHEQGHTYQLSRRPCSTGGPAEYFFGLGCRDEYTHAASDGRPYKGSGFDVLGAVYPSGSGGAPGSREVRDATNFMDTTGARDGGPYDRWIDNLSYDWLTQQLRRPQDPELISLTGFVQVPGGIGSQGGAVTGGLLPSFRYMGLPDRPEAAAGDAAGVGDGQFGVRLVTPAGARLYRLTPAFDADGGSAGDVGMFSLSVPWDPATTRIELVGPGKPADVGQTQGSIVVLAARDVSPKAPSVANLRASVRGPGGALRQAAGAKAGPQDTVVVAWDQADADGQGVSAMLFLIPPRPLGPLAAEPAPIPFGVGLTGGTFEVAAAQLADMPGSYGVRVVVSDGVNTTTLEAPGVFTVDTGVFLPLISR